MISSPRSRRSGIRAHHDDGDGGAQAAAQRHERGAAVDLAPGGGNEHQLVEMYDCAGGKRGIEVGARDRLEDLFAEVSAWSGPSVADAAR
jgi:hypothetical protein